VFPTRPEASMESQAFARLLGDSCPHTSMPIRARQISPEGESVGKKNMPNLTAARVKSEDRPGRHGDGGGLFLVVSASGSKSWVCRVQKFGRRHDYGLGSASKVPLTRARSWRARRVSGWRPDSTRDTSAGRRLVFRPSAKLRARFLRATARAGVMSSIIGSGFDRLRCSSSRGSDRGGFRKSPARCARCAVGNLDDEA
jgi:hypothetical protein